MIQTKQLLIFSILLIVVIQISEAQNLYPRINNEQKWGYVNETKTVIIPFIYDYAARFSNGLGRIKIEGKYGFINKQNETIIPCIYKNARDFSEGFAAVNNGDRWGYINKHGKTITAFKYRKTTPFSNGRAFAAATLNYELIDSTGTACTELVFQDVEPFISPHTTVKQHGLYSLINQKGEVVDSLYDVCWPFRRAEFDSIAFCVARKNDRWFIIDENRKTIWQQETDSTATNHKNTQVTSRGLYLSFSDQKVNICRKRTIHNAVAEGALSIIDSLPDGTKIECTLGVLPGENLYIMVETETADKNLGWSLEGLGGRHFTSLESFNILPLKNLTPSYYKIEFFSVDDGNESKNNRLEYRFYPIDPFH